MIEEKARKIYEDFISILSPKEVGCNDWVVVDLMKILRCVCLCCLGVTGFESPRNREQKYG